MCSPPKAFRRNSNLGLTRLVCFVVICMAICVNHSHQENNLSIDTIKDEEHEHGHGSIHMEEERGASASEFGKLFQFIHYSGCNRILYCLPCGM